MADDGSDLVSQVRIEGTEDATAKLDTLATKGAASFDKLNKAANDSAKGVQKAGQQIQAAGNTATQGASAFGTAQTRLAAFGKEMQNVKELASDLTSRFPQLAQAVGRFTQRVTIAGAAAVAAGTALAKAAQNVAKSYDGQNTALEDNVNAQKDANNAMLEGQVAAINYESQQRKLLQSALDGKITWVQYSQALKQLKKDFDEQQRTAAEVKNAQDAVTEANKRLDKQLADQKATQALIDTFGGPLLSSLVNFGHTIEQVINLIKTNFGPAAASVIDLINGVVSRNFSNISNFFTSAGAKIQAFIAQNGPQIEKFLEIIGAAAAAVFDGLIAAAPSIIDFVNNTLAPAINKIAGILKAVADGINAVFGTRLTAGSLVLIVILGQITGSIRLLLVVTRLFGQVFGGVIKVAGGALTAFAELFAGPLAGNIAKVGTSLLTVTNPFSLFMALIRGAIPLVISLGGAIASALGIGLLPAIAIIGALGVALYYILKNTDFGGLLKDAQAAILGIATLFKGTYDVVSGTIQFWIAQFQQFPVSLGIIWGVIKAVFQAGWDAVKQFASNTWQGITDIWNGAVQFFQGIVQSIEDAFTSVWNFIKDGWNNLLLTVQGYVTAWVTRVKAFIQPLVDLINAVTTAAAGAEGAAGGGAVNAATGGAITGPGSGTSDSIPAWLSNGEFVTKAAAVRKVGVGFMHALNNGRINVRRFAEGGLAAATSLASPSVGYATSNDNASQGAGLRPLNLSILGETFEGLLMPESVAGRLTKFAIAKQNRSAGRKPSWVGRSRN